MNQDLDFTVDLDLADDDLIRVTACGFEADLMNDYMGMDSGYTWAQISAPTLTNEQRNAIAEDLVWQLFGSFADENDAIGHLSWSNPPTERTPQVIRSDIRDYKVRYVIEDRT